MCRDKYPPTSRSGFVVAAAVVVVGCFAGGVVVVCLFVLSI